MFFKNKNKNTTNPPLLSSIGSSLPIKNVTYRKDSFSLHLELMERKQFNGEIVVFMRLHLRYKGFSYYNQYGDVVRNKEEVKSKLIRELSYFPRRYVNYTIKREEAMNRLTDKASDMNSIEIERACTQLL